MDLREDMASSRINTLMGRLAYLTSGLPSDGPSLIAGQGQGRKRTHAGPGLISSAFFWFSRSLRSLGEGIITARQFSLSLPVSQARSPGAIGLHRRNHALIHLCDSVRSSTRERTSSDFNIPKLAGPPASGAPVEGRDSQGSIPGRCGRRHSPRCESRRRRSSRALQRSPELPPRP